LVAYDEIVRAETMVSMLRSWLVYIVYGDTGERQDARARKCTYVGGPLARLTAKHSAARIILAL
jgi:hypothetical protein